MMYQYRGCVSVDAEGAIATTVSEKSPIDS